MPPNDLQLGLKADADRVASTARSIRSWVKEAQKSSPTVSTEADSLTAESRRLESTARKLSTAATRRMCVGIFGASQQGKSYLVSVLAQVPGAGKLLTRFGAETRDFIVDINPQGGKESTALVTRFSVASSEGADDPEFPVDVLLLNELDLVKILGNTFQSDFDQNKVEIRVPRGDDVKAILASAQAKAQKTQLAAHLDEVLVSDLSEYFYRNFRNRWQELSSVNYWERIIDLAPRLPLEARAQLYTPIWGGLTELTQLFLQLATALERLGHPAEAVVEMAALLPRSTSIIDVDTLRRLGTREDAKDLLKVRVRVGPDLGPAVGVQRAVLAALVGELRITMNDTPWPMFEHTDLLDFPGARSRMQMQALPADEAKCAEEVKLMLLRGKVAYLFQRYSDERELTAMLLCMGNKPTNVNDLGPLVRNWIELTHGAGPEARRQVPNSLFLILTMMDLEFVPKAGDDAAAIAAKWDVRLHTSLLEQYQRDEWPLNFNGAPFSNTLMLRNTGFIQPQIVSYTVDPATKAPIKPFHEIGLSTENQAYIGELEHAFMQSGAVRKHVDAPRRAWDAMLRLNDGGVSYIVERLAAVSEPSLKNQQVAQRLSEATRTLHDNLKRFYHGVGAEDKRAKEGALKKLRLALARAMQPRNFRPFGRFVAALTLSPQEVRSIAYDAVSFRPEAQSVEELAIDEDTLESLLRGEASAEGGERPPFLKVTDRADHFARELCSRWVSHLRLMAQDEVLLRHFELDDAVVSDIVDQLIITADRCRLADSIAKLVREATQSAAVRWDDVVDRVAAIANERLNGFVSDLGFRDLPENMRGVSDGTDGKRRLVFQGPPPLAASGRPELGEKPMPLAASFINDWSQAFVQSGVDNLDYGGGRTLTPALNSRLGVLLDGLALSRIPD